MDDHDSNLVAAGVVVSQSHGEKTVSDEDKNLLGCVIDERETDAVCQRLSDAGEVVSFAAGQSSLKGYGAGKNVFLWRAEYELTGKLAGNISQRRGVCVARGTRTACRDSYYHAICYGDLLGDYIEIAFEPIYGGSRVNIGGGSLGRGDGSIGAWAAQWCHDFGLLKRGTYGGIDLTSEREDLAVSWGNPGVGVPTELQEASDSYVCDVHRADTVEDIRDGIAAGYGCAFCSQTLWQNPSAGSNNRRDGDGMCRPAGSGGHCVAFRGVFVDRRGALCFVHQQSWGNDCPSGPNRIHTNDHQEIELPPGACGIFAEDVERPLRTGEAWLFRPRRGWRNSTLAGDVLVKGSVT